LLRVVARARKVPARVGGEFQRAEAWISRSSSARPLAAKLTEEALRVFRQ
jgi:hypothetical protein